MESQKLTPISFIKSTQERERYECVLCFQVCVKPFRCKGTCQKIFCMKCASEWKQQKDHCPNKCSTPFHLEPISDIVIQFACPYNFTTCSLPIMSLKEFHNHHLICPFVPPDQLHRIKLKQEYLCLKGHQLQFFTGTYQQMMETKCQECHAKNLCRSMCRICDQLYCIECRVPPCSKQGCPIGHPFTYQNSANLTYICDFCGGSTKLSNDGAYDDTYCNFILCQSCYNNLPEHSDKSKSKQLVANIHNKCSCGSDLWYKNSIHQLHICTICQRKKECPKLCKNCEKRYCIKCKMMQIQNDMTCTKYDHQLTLFNMKSLPNSQARQQHEYGCMRCMQQCDEYYADTQCRIRLCQQCACYFMTTTAHKKRSLVVKCSFDHVLIYMAGQQTLQGICSQCHQKRVTRLRCFVCRDQDQPNGKPFCFQCKPIKLDTCYYQHKLKLATFSGKGRCSFCFQLFSEFHYCRKCFFYVCKECMIFNQEKFSKMEIEEEHSPESQIQEVEKVEVEMEMDEQEELDEQEQSPGSKIEEVKEAEVGMDEQEQIPENQIN